jgi:hypothetical protein
MDSSTRTATPMRAAGPEHMPGGPAKKRFRRAMVHPVWISAATVIAIAGLVLTLIQMNQGEPDAEDLELGAVTMQEPQQIAATRYNVTNPSLRSPAAATVTPIDITLKNNGGLPAHINTVEAEVVSAADLDCGRQGGESRVSAEYSLRIPYSEVDGVTDSSVAAGVDFTVQPGSTDRLIVTVGLERESHRPVVLAVKLRLIPDTGPPIEIGPVAVVSPDGVENQIGTLEMMSRVAGIGECAGEQGAKLDEVYGVTSMQSAELDRLRDAFAAVA